MPGNEEGRNSPRLVRAPRALSPSVTTVPGRVPAMLLSDNSPMRIRSERAEDVARIRAVNLAAFETPLEADLVDALRARASPFLSLVAEDVDEDAIVGHILFTPVTLDGSGDLRLMGLAPMAVVPSKQRRGVGGVLIRDGIAHCRSLHVDAIVVLGHAGYYPRFGFAPASRFGLRSEYEVPDDVFMAMELREGALQGRNGTIRYHPAFADA